MTRPRDDLIQDLAEDLTPVRSPGRTTGTTFAWLTGAWIFVGAAMLASGSLRPGVGEQILGSARFLLESLLGLAAGAVGIAAALRLGIPRPGAPLGRVAPALALLGLWGALQVYALWDPLLTPSMEGKRAGCWLQTFVFGAPPLAVGLWLARRLAPFARAWTGALLGAVAGALPGLMMQFACMYEPSHNLTHHVAPILALAVLGALLGPRVLRRI